MSDWFLYNYVQDSGSEYLKMRHRDEQDVYLRMQKPDGSYYYILKNQGDESSEFYTCLDGNKENEDECYVKMRRDDGAYYYVAMKEGVCTRPTQIGNKHEYANDPSQDSCPIYSNTESSIQASSDEHGDGEEMYEKMTSGQQEELYEDMVADKKDGPTCDELYEVMQHPESGDVQNPYFIPAGKDLRNVKSFISFAIIKY